MSSRFASDYVTVADRIGAFYERFPDGSLQSDIVELTESRVVIRAVAYRSPDDPRPGVGHASLAIPGSTPYTRGSELENAETSAWGRAIAALGFETKAGVATADEISSKSGAPIPESRPRPAAPVEDRTSGDHGVGLTVGEAFDALKRHGVDTKVASATARRLYGNGFLRELTGAQRAHVVQELTGEPKVDDREWPTAPADLDLR